MPVRRATAPVAALLAALAFPGDARACELVLSEHRSARELLRLPLDPAAPSAHVAFTHSVLGTPVSDHYVWRYDAGQWRAHLVEERFEGEGYGLPQAAAQGETLQRDGDGWRLRLDRVVQPLVVLPLPAQHMRVVVAGRAPVRLGDLSTHSILMRAQHCPPS